MGLLDILNGMQNGRAVRAPRARRMIKAGCRRSPWRSWLCLPTRRSSISAAASQVRLRLRPLRRPPIP